MSFFKKQQVDFLERIKSPIPLEHLDVTKRYDLYCFFPREERLYENVKFIAVRTFDDISKHFAAIGGFVEIEAIDGTRMMLKSCNIHALCEHGAKPKFTILKSWSEPGGQSGMVDGF
jgi:hypothetical protein